MSHEEIMDWIKAKLRERLPIYEQADVTVLAKVTALSFKTKNRDIYSLTRFISNRVILLMLYVRDLSFCQNLNFFIFGTGTA